MGYLDRLLGKTDCDPIINYDKKTGKAGGLDILGKFKLASVEIDQKVLQTAAKMAQVYDMYRISNCKKLKGLKEGSPDWIIFANEHHKNETKLLEFWSLLEALQFDKSGEVAKLLARWMASNYNNMDKDAPVLPGSGFKAGEVVREDTPSEYDDVRISIGEARQSFEYLDQAFSKPTFDINELYRVHLNTKDN